MSIKIITLSIRYGVELFAIRDIDSTRSTVEFGQWAQFLFLGSLSGVKQKAQRRLDQFRHGFTLSRGFLAKSRHDGVVDVQGRFRMANHMRHMAGCQFSKGAL